jgi:hypothetical protein
MTSRLLDVWWNARIESMMEEELGRGLDCASRQMHRCHSMMFHVCLTKKILIRGLASLRDHTS